MNSTQKPFACSVKGCDMTFTNEDHLNWHQKKHDMMLNLGLADKNNEGADQTPTPTRFIRNCEEVGLFQDLQNVNPFDEFFKKAVETGKTGGTLEVPQNLPNSDDTLHTPHILPHIEETQKNISSVNTSSHSQSNSFFSHVNEISDSPVFVADSGESDVDISENNRTDSSSSVTLKDIKLKIKKALETKDKEKPQLCAEISSHYVSVVPLCALTEQKQALLTKKVCKKKEKTVSNEKEKHSSISLERIREMNREAQLRCRKRKKEALKDMEEELKKLREEVKKLKAENHWLKVQLSSKNNNTANKTNENISEVDRTKESEETSSRTNLTATTPTTITSDAAITNTTNQTPSQPTNVTITQNHFTSNAIANPVIIQVVPVAVNQKIELSTVNKSTGGSTGNNKNYRKIVPKIQIDRY